MPTPDRRQLPATDTDRLCARDEELCRDHTGRHRAETTIYILEAELHPDDFEYVVLATVLHELAHILDRPAPFADRTGVEPELLQFERLVVADVSRRPVRMDIPAYHGHGDAFIRLALHLRHRAAPPRELFWW